LLSLQNRKQNKIFNGSAHSLEMYGCPKTRRGLLIEKKRTNKEAKRAMIEKKRTNKEAKRANNKKSEDN
jgi:hypothetical protein